MSVCGYSSLVEHQLPKLDRRVRFPLSAFFIAQVHAGEKSFSLLNCTEAQNGRISVFL
jgi:hypothetical protein